MSALRSALADYLELRRSLGYKLARPEKLLDQFITYLDNVGADTVTVDHALEWARLPGGAPNWAASRLSVVRGFATYLRTVDPTAEVPATDLLAWQPRRASPYLYSDHEVRALMAATRTLRFPLRSATYETLIGLLAVTGMRVGEAIRLDLGDFDPLAGTLLVRWTKFDKTRELPLHPSTVAALRAYTTRPDRPQPAPTPALFISAAGTRLLYRNVHSTFTLLRDHAGLRARSAACRPRVHDYADIRVMPTWVEVA